MKKIMVLILFAVLMPTSVWANGPSVELKSADVDLGNEASLQRGAKYFVNYCMGCHALSYNRYTRVAADIGLTEDQVKDNLIFTTDEKGDPTKVGALMKNAMTKSYGSTAFGTNPPDLSVISRVHGADWLYTYLNSFYLDSSRPMGINNTVFKDVGMPHVLWELQGWQEAVYRYDVVSHGHAIASFDNEVEAKAHAKEHGTEGHHLEVAKVIDHLALVEPGKMSPAEYQQATRDIVNFLQYAGEPAQLSRYKVGFYVLLFLALLFVPAYMMKRDYWKDIH